MSEQQEPKGGLRRVGRKDRKDRLQPGRLEFPQDEAADAGQAANSPFARPPQATPSPDVPADESPSPYVAPVTAEPPATPRAPETRFPPDVIYTPPEERFPPVDPDRRMPPPPPPAPPVPSVAERPYRARRGVVWQDAVAALFAVGTVLLCGYYSVLWFAYNTPLNPFPPFTPIPIIITATPGGAQVLPLPTEPAATIAADFPFISDTPLYMPNANPSGCNWASIGGTITGLNGEPLDGFRVRITGGGLNETVFSGSTQTFGPGGYELPLGGAPQEGTYSVRLFTPSNVPLSDEVSVTTRADCQSNVLLVNFQQVRDF